MESIFCPVPKIAVNIKDSNINENWPCFNFIISEVSFSVQSPLVPSILPSVTIRPVSVIKLFYDHPYSTWEQADFIPSRPLTSITKDPEGSVTRKFQDSTEADIEFRNYLSPYCFNVQMVRSCMELLIKGVHFCL